MNQTTKILLGIATVLPFILFGLYFVSLIQSSSSMSGVQGPDGAAVGLLSLGVTLLIFFSAVLVSIVLFVYYLVHVINNSRLDASNRLIWALIILFFQNFGFIIYWYFQVWREEDDRLEHDYLN